MVKKRIGGSHRYKALKHAAGRESIAEEGSGPKPPQHLQRKITKKVKFFEKVQQSSSVAALSVQKGATKKKSKSKSQLPSLQSLAGELEQLADLQQQSKQSQQLGKGTKSSIKRSKARLAISVTEMQRLQQVMQHPSYKADPIQAITNHLTATLPPAPQQHKRSQQQGAKEKQKQRKSSAGDITAMQD